MVDPRIATAADIFDERFALEEMPELDEGFDSMDTMYGSEAIIRPIAGPRYLRTFTPTRVHAEFPLYADTGDDDNGRS